MHVASSVIAYIRGKVAHALQFKSALRYGGLGPCMLPAAYFKANSLCFTAEEYPVDWALAFCMLLTFSVRHLESLYCMLHKSILEFATACVIFSKTPMLMDQFWSSLPGHSLHYCTLAFPRPASSFSALLYS